MSTATLEQRLSTLKNRLNSSRERLNTVLEAVGDQWETTVYSDGAAWNVHQLLIHLSTAEKGLTGQAQRIAAGEDGVPEDFDLERYNRRSVEKRAAMTVEEARTALAETRAALLEWVNTIESVDTLEQRGLHASMQRLSVEEVIKWIAVHERDHANDIAKVLDSIQD